MRYMTVIWSQGFAIFDFFPGGDLGSVNRIPVLIIIIVVNGEIVGAISIILLYVSIIFSLCVENSHVLWHQTRSYLRVL